MLLSTCSSAVDVELDIFGYKNHVVKSKSYLPMVPEEGAWSTLTIIDKEVHRQRRKVISKALSDSALKDFEPKMIEHMDVFRDQLCGPVDSESWSTAKDMSVLCELFCRGKRDWTTDGD
jgi:cytochrome P450